MSTKETGRGPTSVADRAHRNADIYRTAVGIMRDMALLDYDADREEVLRIIRSWALEMGYHTSADLLR